LMKIRLRKYLKPYMRFVVLAPLMMVLEVAMDLTQPRLMAMVVNDGILGDAGLGFIVRTSLIMLGVAVIGMITGFACTVFAMFAAQNYGADLRSDLFKKVSSFSFAELDQFSTGSLVTRLTNDGTQLQNMVLLALRAFVRAPLLCVGAIVMVLSISRTYGLVIAVVMPVIALTAMFIYKKLAPLFTQIQERLDGLNAIVQENLSGVRVIKAFVRGEHEKSRFGVANEALKDTNLRAMFIMAAVLPLMMIVMNATVLAVIYIGGLQVQAAQMQVGDIMAALSYMTQVLFTFMIMSRIFVSIPRAKASGDRVREVLAAEVSITDGDAAVGSTGGDIVFNNVTFGYGGGEPVLKQISLHIKSGEHVGLLGSTGAGKSSLVHLISRFYDVCDGQVLVDGVDVRDYPLDALRAKIGFVLQESVLFSGTIGENIRWGNPNADDAQVLQAAKSAQADEYITAKEDGYDTLLGQRGLTLSGGQKQRASIARALLKDAEILILDDSTSALDLATESNLNAAINAEHAGKTRITIAQRISSVMNADRIYVLEHGEIAAFGTHEELLETCEIYQDIHRSQMGQGVAA